MTYRIDRTALAAFVDAQADRVEATPLPDDLVVAFPQTDEDLAGEDLRAVWLGAGLATQIGLALLEAPERFVTRRPVAA
jgi:hypothetical protein